MEEDKRGSHILKVFEIERYAIEDGPGIRTVIFLKGCNLRCLWCQNPESQEDRPQIMYYREQCVGCGKCAEACPVSAISNDPLFGFVTKHDVCSLCGDCVDACFYGARKLAGRDWQIDDLMQEILKDKGFFDNSGGGVTFSGGEPLLQHRALSELAARCQSHGIHTALETAGHVSWDILESVLPHLDLVYYDMKHPDPHTHKKYTGASNELILANLARLSRVYSNVIVRIPVIPGVNNSPDTIKQIYAFLRDSTRIKKVELLPYHSFGSGKYEALGWDYEMKGVKSLEKQDCLPLAEAGASFGLQVQVGAGGQ